MVQEWEGRCFGMSNSVTTAIRGSVREMAIGKTRTTEKSDRATVEQVNCTKISLTTLNYQKSVFILVSSCSLFVLFLKLKSFLLGCFVFIFWCLLALDFY